MKKPALFVLLLFYCSVFYSQQRVSDSLQKVLSTASNDSMRCSLLDQLIEQENNDSIWGAYNEQIIYISQKAQAKANDRLKTVYLGFYANALNNKGYLHMLRGNSKDAYKYYSQALEVQNRIKNKEGISYVYLNLGYLCRQDGNVYKAIEYYHNALKLQLETKNTTGAATSYNNIGYIFDGQGEFAKAFEYYQKSLKLYQQVNDKDGIANCYGNLAYIYKTYGDPDCVEVKETCTKKGIEKAITYLNKAIALRKEIGDKSGEANCLNLLGGIYDHYGDPACAGANCENLNHAQALNYYNTALKLRLEENNAVGIILSYNSLADFMLKINDLKQAAAYGKKCFDLSVKLGSPERIKDAALTLKNIYEKQNNYEGSLKMFELYMHMRDSIYNEETKKVALKKGFQIEYEKKATADSVRIEEEKKVISAQLKQEKTQRLALYGGLALVIVFSVFMVNRFMITSRQKKIIELKEKETQQQNTIISQQKHLVEEKQKEILDSINYAKRIQYSLLVHADFLKENIPGNFVYFNPKDIVSGDFYWAANHGNKFYLAVCDSTGHGVPGAFMSLLNMGFLSEAIKEKNITKPHEVFNYVRSRLTDTISSEGQKDGMDGILLCIDKTTNTIEYTAANNEPVLISGGTITELPKDKMPVGKGEKADSFTTYTVPAKSGDALYLYTDGYADQFGGAKGKKYKYKQLNELLLHIASLPVPEQKNKLEQSFNAWKGQQEQVDDVLIIGIRF